MRRRKRRGRRRRKRFGLRKRGGSKERKEKERERERERNAISIHLASRWRLNQPPVLVSATFKFVPLSVLFAEKCLFNSVYRHCKIFTRSLLPQYHHYQWELDEAETLGDVGCRATGERERKREREKFLSKARQIFRQIEHRRLSVRMASDYEI